MIQAASSSGSIEIVDIAELADAKICAVEILNNLSWTEQ